MLIFLIWQLQVAIVPVQTDKRRKHTSTLLETDISHLKEYWDKISKENFNSFDMKPTWSKVGLKTEKLNHVTVMLATMLIDKLKHNHDDDDDNDNDNDDNNIESVTCNFQNSSKCDQSAMTHYQFVRNLHSMKSTVRCSYMPRHLTCYWRSHEWIRSYISHVINLWLAALKSSAIHPWWTLLE